MKIARGNSKGTPLLKPIIKDLNPALSFERQKIFELIEQEANFDFKGKRGLDLFAGSGSLGLEALSAGADFVEFVDKHPDAVKTISLNIHHTRFEGKTKVIKADILDYLLESYHKYDFVFIDPDPQYSALQRIILTITPKINMNGILILKMKSPYIQAFYQYKVVSQTKINRDFVFVLKKSAV